jgi:hypothetical protein
MIAPGTKIRFIDPDDVFEAYSQTQEFERLRHGDVVITCGWCETHACPEYETASSYLNIIMDPYWEVVNTSCECSPPSLLLFGCTCGATR